MSRGKAIQVNNKGINPMRDPDSSIKPPPASLPDLEAELAELLGCRPSNQDLPALAEWNEQKNRLQFWIDLAKASAVPPVFVREGLASLPARIALADEVDPSPEPTPSPSPEVPAVVHQTIHPTRKHPQGRSPREVLAYKISKIGKDTAALLEAKDATTFKRLRNLVHQDRCEARRYAILRDLPVPDLPGLPENPFRGAPKVTAAKIVVTAPNPSVPRDGIRHAVAAVPLKTTPESMGIVSTIRASIWCLAADIERMGPDQRAALQPELALLDAAAHTVHNLAKGQLEVL